MEERKMGMYEEETLIDAVSEEPLLSLLGIRDKSDEALPLKRMLAEKGDQSAMLWMGMYYMRGEVEEQDFAEACYWFHKSRDAEAKVRMAQVYEQEGNEELAVKCYREALEAETDSTGTMKETARRFLAGRQEETAHLPTGAGFQQPLAKEEAHLPNVDTPQPLAHRQTEGSEREMAHCVRETSQEAGKSDSRDTAPQKKGFWSRFFRK